MRVLISAFLMLTTLPAFAQEQERVLPKSTDTSAATSASAAAIPPLPPLPDVDQEAFSRLKDTVAPLSSSQIEKIGELMEQAERSAAEPPRFTPRAVSSGVVANLAPGSTPPVARLFVNHVTTIVFMDQLGNPLKIRSADLGAPKGFTLTTAPLADGSTTYLSLSPTSLYATGNIQVALDGVPTPVSVTLVSGQKEVDYRVDVRVKGITAKGAVQTSGVPSTLDPSALTMLSELTPADAKQLSTSSESISAWQKAQRFYVRTPSGSEMLSPAYLGVARAPDGSAVYEIPPTPVIVVRSGSDRSYVNISGY
ncbi:DotH/IcmK family type IV secretion protein [Xanthomonas euvesicatoria]